MKLDITGKFIQGRISIEINQEIANMFHFDSQHLNRNTHLLEIRYQERISIAINLETAAMFHYDSRHLNRNTHLLEIREESALRLK